MILIGQYDSPFVRRVGVALHLYGMPYEHRPWSTFGDAEQLAAYNPLRRVPTLVLDDGDVLIESMAILDHLDEQAGADRRLLAADGPGRHAALKICALASGLCDKMVSLVYERILHEERSAAWVERCSIQIADVLTVLEAACASLSRAYWFGDEPGHADIAVACAMRFLAEAHPEISSSRPLPSLSGHAIRCEALPAFGKVVQRFIPPNS